MSSLQVHAKPPRLAARARASGGSGQAAEEEEGADRFYLCFHCTASFLEDHKALAANCKVFRSSDPKTIRVFGSLLVPSLVHMMKMIKMSGAQKHKTDGAPPPER